MDAVKSKQNYMKWVRKLMHNVRNDEYLKPRGIEDLTVELYKWDKRGKRGLFVVYDRSSGRTLWNTNCCRWEWISFESTFAKTKMWRLVNDVSCGMLEKTFKN